MGHLDEFRVSVPIGTKGPWEIDTFTIEKGDIGALRYAMEGRSPGLGTFTRLCRNGDLWMSDTDAEIRDHMEAIRSIKALGGRVLIHGLGLGMVVQAALRVEKVTSVDVVEIDQDVIDLVGLHYEKMAAEAGIELHIHCDDVYTRKWPVGSHWDVVWHDIWKDMNEDNLPQMHKLHRSFGRRSGWQGSWGRDYIEYQMRHTQDAWWR